MCETEYPGFGFRVRCRRCVLMRFSVVVLFSTVHDLNEMQSPRPYTEKNKSVCVKHLEDDEAKIKLKREENMYYCVLFIKSLLMCHNKCFLYVRFRRLCTISYNFQWEFILTFFAHSCFLIFIGPTNFFTCPTI